VSHSHSLNSVFRSYGKYNQSEVSQRLPSWPGDLADRRSPGISLVVLSILALLVISSPFYIRTVAIYSLSAEI